MDDGLVAVGQRLGTIVTVELGQVRWQDAADWERWEVALAQGGDARGVIGDLADVTQEGIESSVRFANLYRESGRDRKREGYGEIKRERERERGGGGS